MDGLLPGFEPLAVRRPGHCGPVAMLQLLRYASLRIDYDDLLRVWRFGEGADRLDTPGHHLRTLRRLGMRFAFRRGLDRRTIADALAGPDTRGPSPRLRGDEAAASAAQARRSSVTSGGRSFGRAEGGWPVALLVPTGAVRWHWIVACGHRSGRAGGATGGCAPGGGIVSPGDGVPRFVSWEALDRARRFFGRNSAGEDDVARTARPGRDVDTVQAARPSRDVHTIQTARHAASRLLGIEGLGYVVARADSNRPLPFPTDRGLERDILQLARAAEEALLVGEPVLVWVESLLAKTGWKGTRWSDILDAARLA